MTVIPLRPNTSWMGELSRNERGLFDTVANVLIILGNDPALSKLFAYDEFAHRIVLLRHPPTAYVGAPSANGPYPRQAADYDITLVQSYIQRVYAIKIHRSVAKQGILAHAESHRIHPVREWLATLEWDGIHRLDRWLNDAFGVSDTPYHSAIGRKFLTAACRRVRIPGTKFDTVLVLEGRQGAGKSMACKALFGGDWFTDNLAHDLSSKDAQQGMAGRWGIELAELNVLIRSSHQTAKAFFSRDVDYFRPPYGEMFIERPRQCVFVGTTNEQDYLGDITGNRRYWPVRCEKIDLPLIRQIRGQLWAEASLADRAGEPLWLDKEDVEDQATQHQAERVPEDVWAQKVREWLGERPPETEIRTSDVLIGIGFAIERMGRREEMRVASILTGLGWRKCLAWRGGRMVRFWSNA